MQTLMNQGNDGLQDKFRNITIKQGTTYLFTTLITTELYDFLHDEYNFEITLRLLSLKHQVKIRNIKLFKLRVKQLIMKLFSTIVLNYIISQLHNRPFTPWQDLTFHYNEFGKPLLSDQISFNQSSSNDLISLVVEISESPVGIDLSHAQQNISSNDFLDQFKEIFDKLEINQLLAINDVNQRYMIFNQFWTLKEAFTKLIGSGLNIDLASFHFNLNNNFIDNNSTIDFHKNELIYEFEIQWLENIDITIDKLSSHPLMTPLLGKPIFCRSGTLVNSHQSLPVIISIINLKSTKPINYNLNMLTLLQTLI